ncbi:MAG: LysR family transcriptional regulator [Sporomusaceae bacterium]|nr:LysR family transcriptional regulator [Sporomusaceae bacterium]
MDLRLLKTFLCVAKIENITQAAETMNFSQPTVTAQIKTLEEHFGVLLFERVGKKLYITEAGKCLVGYAEKLLLTHREAQTALDEISCHRTIRIGLGTAVAAHMLSPVLQELHNNKSNVAVSIEHCVDLPETIKGILNNSFDFALVHDTVSHHKILQFNLGLQKLKGVAHTALLQKYGNDIWQYPIVALRQSSLYRKIYDGAFQERNIRPILEYSDSEAVKEAVLKGLGAGILPEILVADSIRDGTLSELQQVPNFAITFSIIFHKEKTFTAETQLLLTRIATQADQGTAFLEYLQAT